MLLISLLCCSNRSLPVMLNVSNYRSPTSPSSHFSSASDVTPRATTQSMFDFEHADSQFGFTRSRLPSSEHVTFSSDGRFVTPDVVRGSRRLPRVSADSARAHDDCKYEFSRGTPAKQLRPQENPFQQFHLRNSDFYSPHSKHMNATTDRQQFAAQHGRQAPAPGPRDVMRDTSLMVDSYSITYGSGSEQYYHSIGTGLRRS